jgi:hypothetical protein
MIWMRHEASFDSGKTNHSTQFWLIEVLRALRRHAGYNLMQWLRLQARLTLTITCTLRNCIFLTRAFVMICSSFTLEIGRWRKSDIHCLWFVTNFRLSRHVVGGSFPVTDWAAELGLPFRFYLFELCWWKSVHTMYFQTRRFGGRNIHISQNVVKSALEALWI